MSGMEILGNGNTETRHSDFIYKKTSVSVNPKYKEKSHKEKKKEGIVCKCRKINLKTPRWDSSKKAVYHSPRTPQPALAIHRKD